MYTRTQNKQNKKKKNGKKKKNLETNDWKTYIIMTYTIFFCFKHRLNSTRECVNVCDDASCDRFSRRRHHLFLS